MDADTQTVLDRNLNRLREVFAKLTDSERQEAVSKLLEGYCPDCYCEDPNSKCQCWNDR